MQQWLKDQSAYQTMHSWEEPEQPAPPPPSARHSWEDCERQDRPSDSDSDSDAEPSPSEDFVQYLVGLLMGRFINARHFCTIMWLACKAGIQAAEPFALKPTSPSGHFQRHCNKKLGIYQQRGKLYQLQAPGIDPNEIGRTTVTINVIPLHEAVNEYLETETSSMLKLEEAAAANELPPSYYSNPVVQEFGSGRVWPLALFVDGVAYSKADTVIGWWVVHIVTGFRQLIAVTRKAQLCECGCRGRCTLYAVFSWLAWGLEALCDGCFPARRHDGECWKEGDRSRADSAGKLLRARCCVVWLKGDWAEYQSTFGLPSWRDSMRPCFGCNCSPDRMHEWLGSNSEALVWRSNHDDDYFTACSRCEIDIVVDAHHHGEILRRLQYDRRQAGSRGRALSIPYEPLGLLPGDRLEACPWILDVGEYDNISQFPAPVRFWRPSMETLARWRNPVFNQKWGLTPARAITVDLMHALNLGVMLVFAQFVVWFMITNNVWAECTTIEETVNLSVHAIRHELRTWYRQRSEAHPDEVLTKVKWGRKTVGDSHERALRLKASQTWTFLLFLIAQLEKHVRRLGAEGARLLAAAKALENFVRLFSAAAPHLTSDQIQEAWSRWKQHLALTQEIPELQIPKRHVMFHLLEKLPFLGNPRYYSNWLDESLNRMLKDACRQISQQTFEESLLLRMPELLQSYFRKRSR